MKRSTLVAMMAALSALVVGSALAQDVRYNFDKDSDFSKFKTYKWVTIQNATVPDELVDKNIKAAVDAQLAAKGLTKTDAEDADLYIGYQGAISEEKQLTSYNTGWATGTGWRRGGMGAGGSSISTGQTSTIYIGQLVIDMYDSAQKSLVWRGMVSKTIDQKAKPDKQEKNLNKAMAKLFKYYPPKAKS